MQNLTRLIIQKIALLVKDMLRIYNITEITFEKYQNAAE